MNKVTNNSIYKFSPINEYSLENLKNNQLFCNHFAAFNDPFECWCIEYTGIPDPEKDTERFLNVIGAWGFTPDRKIEALGDYYEYVEQFDELSFRAKHYIESARISCFCSNIDNLLMWAHYADGLRGFSIEFDKKVLIKNRKEDTEILRVNYTASPPVVDAMVYEVAYDQIQYHELVIEETGNQFKNCSDEVKGYKTALKESRKLLYNLYSMMLATKPLDWKYEKEVRLLFHSNAEDSTGEFFSYPESAIKSIVIGERMSDENRHTLHRIIEDKKIQVKVESAKRDKNSYKVIIN